jgi:hypothetical protein
MVMLTLSASSMHAAVVVGIDENVRQGKGGKQSESPQPDVDAPIVCAGRRYASVNRRSRPQDMCKYGAAIIDLSLRAMARTCADIVARKCLIFSPHNEPVPCPMRPCSTARWCGSRRPPATSQIDPDVIEKLKYARETTKVRLMIRMDDGSRKSFLAWRCRYDDTRGPTKGGIRFHPASTAEEVETLAFWMTFKCAVMNLPYGGGQGRRAGRSAHALQGRAGKRCRAPTSRPSRASSARTGTSPRRTSTPTP